jgi:hypothetical protein
VVAVGPRRRGLLAEEARGLAQRHQWRGRGGWMNHRERERVVRSEEAGTTRYRVPKCNTPGGIIADTIHLQCFLQWNCNLSGFQIQI